MAISREWQGCPDDICRQLEEIAKVEGFSTASNANSKAEALQRSADRLKTIFEQIKEKGSAAYSLGEYRKAAIRYDGTLKHLMAKAYWMNDANKSDIKISFPLTLKSEIDQYIGDKIFEDSNFKSLTLSETILFRMIVNQLEKKLAHLFGNKIALGKADTFDNPLESLPFSASIRLFLTLMHSAYQNFPAFFSQANRGWDKARQILSNALGYAELMSVASEKTVVQRKIVHDHLSARVLKDFDALEEGEQMGIPWGWSALEGGHALFLVLTKKGEECLLDLYNTGDGKKHHPMLVHCGMNLWVNKISYRISAEQAPGFRTFLTSILEPRIFGSIGPSEKFPEGYVNPFDYCNYYTADELYRYLNQYEKTTVEVGPEDQWSQGQQSGICSFKCLQALFYDLAPDLAEPFKIFYYAEVFRLLFNFEAALIAPNETVQMILSHAVANLARRLNKPSEGFPPSAFVTIDEVERWSERLAALAKRGESSSCCPPPPPPLPVLFSGIDGEMEAKPLSRKSIPREHFHQIQPTPRLYAMPAAPKWGGPSRIGASSYVDWLRQAIDYAYECKERDQLPVQFNQPALLFDVLFRDCYLPFLSPALKEEKALLLTEFLENPDLTASAMRCLNRALLLKGKMTDTIFPHADGFLIAHGIYLVLIELALLSDKQQQLEKEQCLSSYSLSTHFWESFRKIRLTEMRFYDPTLASDFQWIKEGMEGLKDSLKNPFFKDFEFSYWLRDEGGEVEYIKAHKQRLSDSERELAAAAYEEAVKAPRPARVKAVGFDRWLIAWMFTHEGCLPRQFNELLRANLTLFELTPWKSTGFGEIDMVQPGFKDFDNDSIWIEFCHSSIGQRGDPYKKTLRYPVDAKAKGAFYGHETLKKLDDVNIPKENHIPYKIKPETRMAQLAQASSHPIRFLTMIDFYRHNWDLLVTFNGFEHEHWISNLLLSPNGLYSALKKAPQLSDELTSFFEGAIAHFECAKKSKFSKNNDSLLSFFYRHYLHFLMVERECLPPHRDEKIIQFQNRLLRMPVSGDAAAAYEYYNTLLTSYSGCSTLSEEGFIQIVKSLFAMRKSLDGCMSTKVLRLDTPGGIYSLYRHRERVLEILRQPGMEKEVLKILMESVGIPEGPCNYSFKYFPRAEIHTAEAGYLFDLAEGCLIYSTLQRDELKKGELNSHPFYSLIVNDLDFNSRNDLKVWEEADHCVLENRGVRTRLYADGSAVMEARGKSYAAHRMPEVLQEFFPKSPILWVPRGEGEEDCNNWSRDFSALKRNGRVQFEEIEGEWELLERPKEGHPFFQFDSRALWGRGTGPESGKVCVLFPNLQLNKKKAAFIFDGETWLMAGYPHLHLASSQDLSGVDLFGKYLIFENRLTGRRQLLMPLIDPEELTEYSIKNEKALLFLDLQGNTIASQTTPLQNLYCAYLFYKTAKQPREFVEAFRYLDAAKVLRRYNEEEMKAFELIIDYHGRMRDFNPFKKRRDMSPPAIAFRLNALLQFKENFSQFMIYGTDPFNDAEANQELFQDYISKLNDLPEEFRVGNRLAPSLIELWLDCSPIRKTVYCPPQLESKRRNLDSDGLVYHYHSTSSISEKRYLSLLATKPKYDFDYLRDLVRKASQEERAEIEQKLRFGYLEETRVQDELYILFLELYVADPSSPMHEVACALRNDLEMKKGHTRYSHVFVEGYHSHLDEFDKMLRQRLSGGDRVQVDYQGAFPEKQFFHLSEYVFEPSIFEIAPMALFTLHESHFNDLFLLPAAEMQGEFPHLFIPPKAMKKEVALRIDALNQELAYGAEKNRSYRKMRLLKSPEETKAAIESSVGCSLKKLRKSDKQRIRQLFKEIERVGNKALAEDPQLRADVVGNKRRRQTVADLILLMVQRDPAKISRATGIKKKQHLRSLVDLIAEYLQLTIRTRHTGDCLKAISRLKGLTDSALLEALQNIGYLLSYRECTIDHPDIFVQLILQWACGFIARPNQLASLQQMFHRGQLRDVIKQVVQADGKTFALGPFLALLNADGEHLSLHVDPKHQYEATLSTLGGQVQRSIGKMLYTFEYDDSSRQCTSSYLQSTFERLKVAIAEKVPVAATQDSLRALRSRYIEGCIRLYNGAAVQDRKELECLVGDFRNILKLFRTKGLFAPLEEVHEGIDPTKIHNIPSGAVYFINDDALFFILDLLIAAETAQSEEGGHLLDILNNRQAQQTPQNREKMMRRLAGICVRDERWLKLAGIQAPDEALERYLWDKEASPPEEVARSIRQHEKKPKEMTPIEFLLMTRQLLAGKWLEKALSKSVYEHFLIPVDDLVRLTKEHPTAVPCIANMCPALDSEFSNPYMMALNTLIASFVQGIHAKQFESFIRFNRLRAKIEARNLDLPIKETPFYALFSRLFERAGVQGNLFNFTCTLEAVKRLQEVMKTKDSEILSLIGHFICRKVLLQKKLYSEEISANGVNVATMGKSAVGYSGTHDNPYTTAVMDHEGRRIAPLPDEGTDGQTLDLLINRHESVYLMGNDSHSLFADVVAALPEEKRSRLRMIVDGGSHFRGIDPFDVALEMAKCSIAFKIPCKAVLSYDVETRLPFAIMCEEPFERVPVAGQRIESIAKELGIAEDEVAVFLPQFKATGTDLIIKADAVGIYTVTENTNSFQLIQQVRRLRELHNKQEAICALQQGALGKISATLEKPGIALMKLGKVEEKKFMIDLILYCYNNRFEPLGEESYLLCVQNLKNIVMQYLLDGIYSGKFSEKSVFTEARKLFCERISIDFVEETGRPKCVVSQRMHLQAVSKKIFSFLESSTFAIPEEEKGAIAKTLEETIEFFLPALPGEIEVAEIAEAASCKESGTMVQIRNQQQQQQQDVKRDEIRQRMQIWRRNTSQWGNPIDQTRLTRKHITEESFPLVKPLRFSESGDFDHGGEAGNGLDHHSVDDVLAYLYKDLWQPGAFAKNFTASVNWLCSAKGIINVGDDYQKPLAFVVLNQRQGRYSLALTTQENAGQLADIFKGGVTLSEGEELWLLRVNGDLAWQGPSRYDKKALLANREVRSLLLQAMLFSGKLELLDQSFWLKTLEEWLKTHPCKAFIKRFFEESALRYSKYETYVLSNVCKIFSNLA